MDNQKKIGNFEIIEEIARGGMGIVYKAHQKGIERPVALKVLNAESLQNEKSQRRFFREAEAIAQLDHENIVKIFHMGKEPIPHFSMQYFQGGTLEQWVDNSFVSLETKIKTIAKICRAMNYAHQKQLLHRDLKPSNILLDEKENPYVSDFGLVRNLGQTSRLTRTGESIGTILYMSPEQIGGDVPTEQSDLYSLGVMIYELVAGKRPFAGNFSQICKQITSGSFCLKEVQEVSPDLAAICQKSMMLNFRERYSSAEDIALDLERYLRGEKTFARQSLGQRQFLHLIYKLAATLLVVAMGFYFVTDESSTKVTPSSLWKQAHQQYQNKDYEQTLALLNELQQIRPNFIPARLLKCQTWEKNGNYDKLKFAWLRLLEEELSISQSKLLAEQSYRLGHFQIALRFFSNLEQLDSETQKTLAKTYSALQQKEQAYNLYKNIPEDDEVIIGRATYYFHIQKYFAVSREIQKLKDRQLSPALDIQKWLLKANIIWRQLGLNRWNWIFIDKEKTLKAQEIEDRLSLVESYLQKAKEITATFSPITHYEKLIIQEVDLHLGLVQLEKNMIKLNQEWLQLFNTQSNFSHKGLYDRSFFKQVVLRYFLRNKEWQSAHRYSEMAIQQTPLNSTLYSLNAIALREMGELALAKENGEQSLYLNPLYSESFEFGLGYIFENVNHQEFHHWLSMTQFIRGRQLLFQHLFFSRFLREEQRAFSQQKKRTEFSSKELLEIIAISKSQASKSLAMQTFATNYTKEDLLASLDRNVAQLTDIDLKTLKQKVAEQDQKKFQENIHRLLMLYAIFTKTEHLQLLWQNNQETIPVLMEFFTSSAQTPFIRLAAAEVLIQIGDVHILHKIRNIAESDAFPNNILAMAALKRKIDYLGNIFSPSDLPWNELSHEENVFYRLLLSLYLDTKKYKMFVNRFLNDPEPLVALAAFDNLRRERFFRHSRIESFVLDKDQEIRSIAARVLWNTIYKEVDYEFFSERRVERFLEVWQAYKKTIHSFLLSNDLEKQNLAMMFFVNHSITMRSLPPRFFAEDSTMKDVFEHLQKLLKLSSAFGIERWSSGVIADGRPDLILPIIQKEELSGFSRAGLLRGLLEGRLFFKGLPIVEKLFLSPDRNIEDRKFKILIGLFFGSLHPGKARARFLTPSPKLLPYLEKRYHGVIKKIFDRYKNDPYLYLLPLSCVGLGDVKYLPRLKSAWSKAKDKKKKRVLLTSILGLTLEHKPDELSQIREVIQNSGDNRKFFQNATYWFVNFWLDSEFLIPRVVQRRVDFFDSQSEYYYYFRLGCEKHWQKNLKVALKFWEAIDWYYQLALISVKFNEIEEGQRYLQRAISLLSDDSYINLSNDSKEALQARCFTLLAEIYIFQDNMDSAKSLLLKAQDLVPSYYAAFFQMGRLLEKQGDKKLAEMMYWKSLYLKPNYVECILRITHLKMEDSPVVGLKFFEDVFYNHFRYEKVFPVIFSQDVLDKLSQYPQAVKMFPQAWQEDLGTE